MTVGFKLKSPRGVAVPVTEMVSVLPFAATTETLPEIAPGAVGAAVIESVQDKFTPREAGQPVAEMPVPDGVTVRVAAAVPVLVTITVTGVETVPTSTDEPTLTVAVGAVRFALGVAPTSPTLGPASMPDFDSLPPQPTTVSMPMSPRQFA
jgi:hypothetical protein